MSRLPLRCYVPAYARGVGFERLILPPGLRERILAIDMSEKKEDQQWARVAYGVMNPSWLTCYPAFSHRGEVMFSELQEGHRGGTGSSEMRWAIEVQPRVNGERAVKFVTNLIVPAFANNLAQRLCHRCANSQQQIQNQKELQAKAGTGKETGVRHEKRGALVNKKNELVFEWVGSPASSPSRRGNPDSPGSEPN